MIQMTTLPSAIYFALVDDENDNANNDDDNDNDKDGIFTMSLFILRWLMTIMTITKMTALP
jgi:hypothetical protein